MCTTEICAHIHARYVLSCSILKELNKKNEKKNIQLIHNYTSNRTLIFLEVLLERLRILPTYERILTSNLKLAYRQASCPPTHGQHPCYPRYVCIGTFIFLDSSIPCYVAFPIVCRGIRPGLLKRSISVEFLLLPLSP